MKAPVGTLSITNPDEVHATPCGDEIGQSFFTYYISPDAMKSLNNNEEVFFEDRIIYDEELFVGFYKLSMCYNQFDSLYEKRLVGLIKMLIAKYATQQIYKYSTTRLFQNFIEEADLEKFSLSKTARQFGLDKYKFLRLFKQETGLTPNKFVILQKVEKSKNMPSRGNTIFESAIDSGFYDTAHFYRHFKKITGVTPMDYQNAVMSL